MRLWVALIVGAAAGLIVSGLVNASLYSPHDLVWPPNLTGFWGLLYGSFAGLVCFGIAFWLSTRRSSPWSKFGLVIAAVALGVFGLAVASWILMWGVPPFTLEGSWMFPLAALPLIVALALFRTIRRAGGSPAGDTDEPQTRWGSDLYR